MEDFGKDFLECSLGFWKSKVKFFGAARLVIASNGQSDFLAIGKVNSSERVHKRKPVN